MSSIKLNVGGTLFETSIAVLEHSVYFKNMFEMFNDNIPEIIFVDRDPDNFKHVLKFLRDENYKIPCEIESELKFFLIDYNDENILDKIKINVGGTIFETNKSTATKSYFLRQLINNNTYIFVDRDPDNFKHILNFMRDRNYKVPHTLRYELEFYKINYSIINLEYIFPKNFINSLDFISNYCETCNHELTSSEFNLSKKIHIYLSYVFKYNINHIGYYCKNCVWRIMESYESYDSYDSYVSNSITCGEHDFSYHKNIDEIFKLHKCYRCMKK